MAIQGIELADLLTIMQIIGVVLVGSIGWIIRLEVALNNAKNQIQFNTERDKERGAMFEKFIQEVRDELKSIHVELKTINDYITAEKALKGHNG